MLSKSWYISVRVGSKQGIIIMRVIVAAVLAVTLSATSLWAADTAAPLAPGKPAGVKKAQDMGDLGWLLVGAGAIVGVVIIASNSGGAYITPTTQ
jgi:hypothetical protein